MTARRWQRQTHPHGALVDTPNVAFRLPRSDADSVIREAEAFGVSPSVVYRLAVKAWLDTSYVVRKKMLLSLREQG